jgi:biotin-(acetyl-CoA carboxylase) ligase
VQFKRKLLFFDTIDSTHEYAKSVCHLTDPNSLTCIRAYTQTRGVGQQERPWISLEGNLLASYIVKIPPNLYPESANFLSLCLYQAIDLKGRHVCFKEPNDLFFEGKKCAGFLCHQVNDRLILSYGLNTALAPTGFSALEVDTEELFQEIDNNIYTWIPTFLQKGFTPFRQEWETVRRHFEKL